MSATNRGSIRNESDYYPTPLNSLQPLLDLIDWSKINTFLEPCRGQGHILDAVTDLVTDKGDSIEAYVDYCEITEGSDYLTFKPTEKYDLILTNPPFSLAKEFLQKSLKESDCVCYLLRLNFLGGQKRKKELWDIIGNPNKLFILSKRPSFTGKGTDATEYAWFCWDSKNIINLPNGIHIL